MYLLNDVKTRMADGSAPDCLTAQALSNTDQNRLSDLDIAYTVSTPFGAGIETVSTPSIFRSSLD